MRVMGIDISTKTGVGVVDDNLRVLLGEQVTFAKLRGWERASAIAARVMELHAEYQPDLIVIENYGFANANSLVTLVEVGTIIRYFLWQEGLPYIDVPPNSLKKFVTGKGQAKKEEIMMYVLKRWDYTSKTNDIADAVGLGMFGLGCLGVKFDAKATEAVVEVMKSQGDVVNSVRKSLQLSALPIDKLQ